MMVQGVSALTGAVGTQAGSSAVWSASSTGSTDGFLTWLGQALQSASDLSGQADALAATYAAGGPVTVDQLMIAEQQASLALSLVVQTRDRAVSAYQTLMNMQL